MRRVRSNMTLPKFLSLASKPIGAIAGGLFLALFSGPVAATLDGYCAGPFPPPCGVTSINRPQDFGFTTSPGPSPVICSSMCGTEQADELQHSHKLLQPFLAPVSSARGCRRRPLARYLPSIGGVSPPCSAVSSSDRNRASILNLRRSAVGRVLPVEDR
jgi:hypothetical protein